VHARRLDALDGPAVDGVALLQAHALARLVAPHQRDGAGARPVARQHAEQREGVGIGQALGDDRGWRRRRRHHWRLDRAPRLLEQGPANGIVKLVERQAGQRQGASAIAAWLRVYAQRGRLGAGLVWRGFVGCGNARRASGTGAPVGPAVPQEHGRRHCREAEQQRYAAAAFS